MTNMVTQNGNKPYRIKQGSSKTTNSIFKNIATYWQLFLSQFQKKHLFGL